MTEFRLAPMSGGILALTLMVLVAPMAVVWPLRREHIPRADIVGVRLTAARDLRREAGWGVRIGAGGLWGGFGWLWTQRRASCACTSRGPTVSCGSRGGTALAHLARTT